MPGARLAMFVNTTGRCSNRVGLLAARSSYWHNSGHFLLGRPTRENGDAAQQS